MNSSNILKTFLLSFTTLTAQPSQIAKAETQIAKKSLDIIENTVLVPKAKTKLSNFYFDALSPRPNEVRLPQVAKTEGPKGPRPLKNNVYAPLMKETKSNLNRKIQLGKIHHKQIKKELGYLAMSHGL